MIEPTDEMRDAFYDEDIGCDVPGCVDCFDDRLAAVLAVVARERCMEPAGHDFHPLAKDRPPKWRCNKTARCIQEDGHDGPHGFGVVAWREGTP